MRALFTGGNGFIGSRGVLEEIPERAMPGTFIAGLYDKSGAQVEELVNLPNPINFIVAAEGEKLDMRFMEYLHHRRYLDMQKGMLFRRTIFQDGNRFGLIPSLIQEFRKRHIRVDILRMVAQDFTVDLFDFAEATEFEEIVGQPLENQIGMSGIFVE